MADEPRYWRLLNRLASVLQVLSATDTWKWIVSIVPGGVIGGLSWLWHFSLPVALTLALVAWTMTLTALNQLHIRRTIRGASMSDPSLQERNLPHAQAQELAAPYVRGRRISIIDLTTPQDVLVRQKTFEHCDLFGPAVVSFTGSGLLSQCSFAAPQTNIENILIEVAPNRYVAGVVGFAGCTLRDCRFFGVSIAGTREQIDMFRTELLAGTAARQRGQ
jgi:hypothetical protein